MHNNIMAAGSRDRPPMLATGRYAQWRSRFLRYIDTRPNGDALRKCILTGPYTPTMVTTPAVSSNSGFARPFHLILKEFGDEIYQTVDACQRQLKKCGKPSTEEEWLIQQWIEAMLRMNLSVVRLKVGNSFDKPFWHKPRVTAQEEGIDFVHEYICSVDRLVDVRDLCSICAPTRQSIPYMDKALYGLIQATRSLLVTKSLSHTPCDSAQKFRVILFSIHNDEWKSFQSQHQTSLRSLGVMENKQAGKSNTYVLERSYALSWQKPLSREISLNLPDHSHIRSPALIDNCFIAGIHNDGVGCASFSWEKLKTQDFRTNYEYKIFLQRYSSLYREIVSMLSDDAKVYENVGQDTMIATRWQRDDIQNEKDKDLKILGPNKDNSKDNDKASRSMITIV
ncbi:hypothetical protein Tco_0502353 [Tanacetum coccineum]